MGFPSKTSNFFALCLLHSSRQERSNEDQKFSASFFFFKCLTQDRASLTGSPLGCFWIHFEKNEPLVSTPPALTDSGGTQIASRNSSRVAQGASPLWARLGSTPEPVGR